MQIYMLDNYFGVLILILIAASCVDLKVHRIPNLLSLGGIIVGLLIQTVFQGAEGFLNSLGGLSVGFFVFLPGYIRGHMGAGDVKLMAAVGAFLSPMETLLAIAYTLICGGVFAVLLLVLHKNALPTFRRYYSTFEYLFTTGQISHVPPSDEDAASQYFPYALAIATGTLLAHFWPLI